MFCLIPQVDMPEVAQVFFPASFNQVNVYYYTYGY